MKPLHKSFLALIALFSLSAHAERLSLAQLKAQLDELAQQMEAMQNQQTGISVAGKQCPTGAAVTGFDQAGNPECGAPWPGAPLPEIFEFNFTCERQFDEQSLNASLSDTFDELTSRIAFELERTFDFNIIEVTFSDIDVQIPNGANFRSYLVESNQSAPCADELNIQVTINGFSIEGEVETNGEFSRFTYSADEVIVNQLAEFNVPDPTSFALPASVPREIVNVADGSASIVNDLLELENEDIIPDVFIAVGLGTITSLIRSELSEIVGQVAGTNVTPIVLAMPTPVTVHYTEK